MENDYCKKCIHCDVESSLFENHLKCVPRDKYVYEIMECNIRILEKAKNAKDHLGNYKEN